MKRLLSSLLVLVSMAVSLVSLANPATRLEPHHGERTPSSPSMTHCSETQRLDVRPLEQRLNANFVEVTVPCHDHLLHGSVAAAPGRNEEERGSIAPTLTERKSRL